MAAAISAVVKLDLASATSHSIKQLLEPGLVKQIEISNLRAGLSTEITYIYRWGRTVLDLHVYRCSPSPKISTSILELRSQCAYFGIRNSVRIK